MSEALPGGLHHPQPLSGTLWQPRPTVDTAAGHLLGLLGAGHMAGAWRARALCALTGKFLSLLTPALQGRTR